MPGPLARAERARRWLLDQAWPLWAEAGLDPDRRAFHEHLRHEDLACGADHRRLRVLARQVYVFSLAAAHGFAPGAAVARAGLDRLLGAARGKDGLYPSRFDLDHAPLNRGPLDGGRDLYDHAFVLLALATAASGPVPVADPGTLHRTARDLLHAFHTRFRHAAGGFVESLPPALPRRQNPHMHLLEAALAAHATFGDAEFAALAAELGDLFLDRLLLPAGVLPEFYDDALRPLDPVRAEPGHHFEWVWLLDGLARLPAAAPRRAALAAASDALYRFAATHGVCPQRNVAVDGLDGAGRVTDATARLWPQTERLKAEVTRALARPGPDTLAALAAADDGLAAYLAAGRPGLWAEHMGADGRFLPGPAPASSLYHITCALLTLIEAAPRLAVASA